MKYLALLVFTFALFSYTTISKEKDKSKENISIQDAIKSKMISTELFSNGGHMERCMKLKIKNISNTDTTFYLEPGRRFLSLDSTLQDILIVKEESILLAAGQEAVIDCYGFCCQVHNSSPSKNSQFLIGGMADDNLIKLSNYLNKNKFPASAMQGAVWVVSDDNPLSSISTNDPDDVEKVRQLQKFVARLKNISLDHIWYSIKFKTDTTRLFSGVADTLFGEIEYELWNHCQANMIMYDKNGTVLSRFFVDKYHGPDKYIYPVKFSVAGWPKGNYFIRLFADGQMKIEKKFKI